MGDWLCPGPDCPQIEHTAGQGQQWVQTDSQQFQLQWTGDLCGRHNDQGQDGDGRGGGGEQHGDSLL